MFRRSRAFNLSVVALVCGQAACGGQESTAPALMLGTADPATGSVFSTLSVGGIVPYYSEGQRRLQMQMGIAARGLGRDVTGTFTITDPATGARAERIFSRVLLVCDDGTWCRQFPLEVFAADLGAGLMVAPEALTEVLDGRAVTVAATFTNRNDPTASASASMAAVLRKF